VRLTLTVDEALVLFDLLHRWENDHAVGEPADHGERVALWNLSAMLERELVEPLDPKYPDLLAAAKGRLIDRE